MEGEEKQEGPACAKRISTSRALADTRASLRRQLSPRLSSGSLSIRRDATPHKKKYSDEPDESDARACTQSSAAHQMHAKPLAATG